MALAASKEAELADNSEWLLYIACTSFRLLVTLHFFLDLESELTIASETLQKHNLAPSDVIFCIELLYESIGMLYVTNGVALQGFLDMYDSETETFKGISLSEPTRGMTLFQADRKEILDSLLT